MRQEETHASGIPGRSFEELRIAERLPSPSGLCLSLLGLSRDGADATPAILEHVRADAVLTGRILKLANATRPAGTPPRLSAAAAAADLDGAVVRSLALGFNLAPKSTEDACEGFDHGRHWLLSLATAASAEALAQSFRAEDTEVAFTIGLLCQVGKLAMASLHPEAYAKVLRECAGAGERCRIETEQREFHTDHWQVAADLMQDWGIPPSFVEPVLGLSRGSTGSDGRAPIEDDSSTIRSSSLLKLAVEMGEEIVRRAADEGASPAEPGAATDGLSLEESLARENAEARWRDLADLCGLGTIALASEGSTPHETTSSTTCEKSTLESTTQPTATSSSTRSSEAPHAGTKPRARVLVVDDEPGMRYLLGVHLGGAGYDVLFAPDGETGLATVLTESPEIVVTDWMMPGLSGIDLVRALRRTEWGRRLHVLLLTSLADEDRVVEGLEAGANDFLTKPFNPRILLARVRAGERMVALQRQVEQIQQVDRRRMAQMGQLTRQLRNAALMDALTGLPNRRSAMSQLEEAWSVARRSGRLLSVVMIDIDRFKRVNDELGHQAGDAVLRSVAKTLRKQTRRSDHLCRLGGEEFLLIAMNATAEAATVGAERLRAAIEATPVACGELDRHVTVSLGVAELTDEMERIDDLVRRADQAVCLAKEGGRNCVRVWEPPERRALSA